MSEKPKKPVFLSASKIDTYKSCTALYCAKYIHKIPDPGNDGSRRGSTVHDTLEILLNSRHHKVYSAAIHHGSCMDVPALWRTIRRFARKYGVDDQDNLAMIDGFMMVALKNEFHGPKNTIKAEAEKSFELTIDRGDGRRWNARGFLDQVFTVKGKNGLVLVVRDFKTAREVFQGDKLIFNIQSLIYQLALRELYPEIKERTFHFLFVKFPKKARQDQPSFNDTELDGFEWILTDLQNAMESFTEENALDHVAADDVESRWLCGKEGLRKDGTPAWICSARTPLDYFVLLDEDGEIIKSAFTEDDLVAKDGQKIESRHYGGCPVYYDPVTGQKRRF